MKLAVAYYRENETWKTAIGTWEGRLVYTSEVWHKYWPNIPKHSEQPGALMRLPVSVRLFLVKVLAAIPQRLLNLTRHWYQATPSVPHTLKVKRRVTESMLDYT